MEKRTCPNCGKAFTPKTAKQVYCGRSCAAYGRAGKRREKKPTLKQEPVKRLCEHCGKAYGPRSKNQRFCSRKCAGLAEAARGREKYEARIAKLEEKTCVLCGKAYRPTHRNQKYCSRQCASKMGKSAFVKEADRPRDMTDIRITVDIPVFPALRPVVGKVYRAERGQEQHGRRFYVIQVGERPVIVREGECVEV